MSNSDFSEIMTKAVSIEAQPSDLMPVKPFKKKLETRAQLIARILLDKVLETSVEDIKKPAPQQKRRASNLKMSSKVKVIRLEEPKCPNEVKSHQMSENIEVQSGSYKDFKVIAASTQNTALNYSMPSAIIPNAVEMKIDAHSFPCLNAGSASRLKSIEQTEFNNSTYDVLPMDISFPEHFLIPKVEIIEDDEPLDSSLATLADPQLAKYVDWAPKLSVQPLPRFTIPNNNTGTKTSRTYAAVSSILENHTAEPIRLLQPGEEPIEEPSENSELSFILQGELITPKLQTNGIKTKNPSYIADIKKPMSKAKIFIDIDDDEADPDDTDMLQLRSAVRTTISADSSTNGLLEKLFLEKMQEDAFNFETAISLESTRNPIDDTYHVNKARGALGRKDGESDAQFEKRMKDNATNRKSKRKARALFQLNKIAHSFYDITNTNTVQLINENRLKMMEKLKTLDHPLNPLYDALQTDALEEYKKKFFVSKGQMAINRFVQEKFTVFEL